MSELSLVSGSIPERKWFVTNNSLSSPRRRVVVIAALSLALCLCLGLGRSVAQSLVIEPRFENAGLFHEGIAPVQVGKRWGFIDTRGNLVVPARYEKVLSGSEGRFAVLENGLWGFIKTNGQVAISPRYQEVKPFSDGVAGFKENGKWGYVGPTGVVELEPRFSYAGQRYEGHHFVDGGPGFGFRLSNSIGQWIDRFDGSAASDFADGYATSVQSDGASHVVDLSGSQSPVPFKEIGPFNQGLAPASSDGKLWGFINGEGAFVIKPRYMKAKAFNGDLAPVQLSGKWGFINRKGLLVEKAQYDNAFAPREGFALIRIGKLRGFLRVQGEKLIAVEKPQYDDAYAFQEGFAPVSIKGKWGYLALPSSDYAAQRSIVDLGVPPDIPVWTY